jgi:hypothetical protein
MSYEFVTCLKTTANSTWIQTEDKNSLGQLNLESISKIVGKSVDKLKNPDFRVQFIFDPVIIIVLLLGWWFVYRNNTCVLFIL